METYGYIRVSTKDQNEDRQLIAMQGLAIPENNIFVDRLNCSPSSRQRKKI